MINSTEKQFEQHAHGGMDSKRIYWQDLNKRKFLVTHTIVDTDAATAAKYGVIFTAPYPCILLSMRETHKTAGSDGGTVTVDIEKLTSGQALDAGVSMLNSALSLKSTANTPQSATLTATLANRNLATDDRIALKDAGTLTAVNHVNIILELQIT